MYFKPLRPGIESHMAATHFAVSCGMADAYAFTSIPQLHKDADNNSKKTQLTGSAPNAPKRGGHADTENN